MAMETRREQRRGENPKAALLQRIPLHRRNGRF